MKKMFFLGFLLLVGGFSAISCSAQAKQKTDWHRISDEATVVNLTKKITPYFGKSTTKTITDSAGRTVLLLIPVPKHSGEDSIIDVVLTEYNTKNSIAETKLQLHQWHDRWYTAESYSDKPWLYYVLKKVTERL